MYPVIVCIAKQETKYIEEFVKYHLGLGFSHIYVYDNEDEPVYEEFLKQYKDWVTVFHLPHNHYDVGVQYVALEHFLRLPNRHITHVAHIDIDEFICLKKHTNIKDFIEEYIQGDCVGIGMNWRYFGSSGHTEYSNESITSRFTRCGKEGNEHIKSLFKRDAVYMFRTCHDIIPNYGHVKATNGHIINGPLNSNIDLSVIQLNHYKCKTLSEFQEIRKRRRADLPTRRTPDEDVEEDFKKYDMNDDEDLTAKLFYESIRDNVTG